jgi:hypothetical protein
VSLYRQPGRVATRTLSLAVVAALVVGLIGGYAGGRASKGEPSLSDKIADLRSALDPARDGLELVQTEYAQAVQGGRVRQQTEYAAARADVARALKAVNGHHDDLAALDRSGTQALDNAFGALSRAVDQRLQAPQVARLARTAQSALDAVIGPAAR